MGHSLSFQNAKAPMILPPNPQCKTKATPRISHMRTKHQAALLGKSINQLGQVAKAETICLLQKHPVNIKDLIREASVCTVWVLGSFY